jgi:hypothetical protein
VAIFWGLGRELCLFGQCELRVLSLESSGVGIAVDSLVPDFAAGADSIMGAEVDLEEPIFSGHQSRLAHAL